MQDTNALLVLKISIGYNPIYFVETLLLLDLCFSKTSLQYLAIDIKNSICNQEILIKSTHDAIRMPNLSRFDLNLNDNKLDDQCAQEICRRLEGLTSLQTLALDLNNDQLTI